MPDPTTSNILLAIPTRGSDSGTWDLPVNGNMSGLDGMLGGNTTIALSSATSFLLSTPSTGTVSASAGPNQSQNNVVKFTGTMTGNASIQVPLPRTYTFDLTGLTMGTALLVISPGSGVGTGQVALPPGEITQVVFDGTNCNFVNMGRVGSFLDLAVSATPAWISNTTRIPYLLCDGSTYSTSVYPALGAILGSTFGGNGINTFGVPDVQSRIRISLDTGGVNRVTNAVSGIAGATIAAAGGDQRLQSHTHTATVTDNGHAHSYPRGTPGSDVFGVTNITNSAITTSSVSTTGISVANANVGTGSSQNMPPVIVFGLTFIKT